jgi:hypothetical protein
MTKPHSITAEAQSRRSSRSSHASLEPISSDAIFVNQPSSDSSQTNVTPPTNTAPDSSPVSQVLPDNQLFNDTVKKLEEALSSLPTIAVVRL